MGRAGPRLAPRLALCLALCLALLAAAPAAVAQDAPDDLPDFATCLAAEVARFENHLDALRNRPRDWREADVGRPLDVVYCGDLGLTICDRGDALLPCQRALGARSEALRARVLAVLPEPGAVPAGTARNLRQLYARVFALAHGASAGADCAGGAEPYTTWCETRAATGRLANAVMGWQVARYLDITGPASGAGWVAASRAARPRPRPVARQ